MHGEGADVDKQDSAGYTALMRASEYDLVDIACILLAGGQYSHTFVYLLRLKR